MSKLYSLMNVGMCVCEFNKYVIYACICIHVYMIYLYTFILNLQTAREKGSLSGNQKVFLHISRTRHILCHPPTGTCRLGHGWDATGGWGGRARSLPAAQGWRQQQQQQLSARDTEPTAPSRRAHRTSLVLAEVCGWCCLTGLKMTVPDHLKQGQTEVCGEP